MKTQLCVLYISILLLKTCCCTTEKTIYKITDTVLKCSTWLSILIESLCNKVIKIEKRDTTSFMDRLIPEGLQEHMYKQRLLTSERWRRVRRQVATECCERACTVATVIMYCPDDARLVKEDPEIFYNL